MITGEINTLPSLNESENTHTYTQRRTRATNSDYIWFTGRINTSLSMNEKTHTHLKSYKERDTQSNRNYIT